MKRNSNEQPLKEVIEQFLRVYRLDKKMSKQDVIDSWEEIVGPMIAKHTTQLYITGPTLYLKINSAPLRQELSYNIEKLLELVNTKVGSDLIKKIHLK